MNFAFIQQNSLGESRFYALREKGVEIGNIKELWSEGKDCEVLRLGAKGWQKGKLRIKVSVDFSPDEPDIEEPLASDEIKIAQPESPLDDIRRELLLSK